MNSTDDDYQPISALNDLLYCERRCALHRIENVWVDNVHTVSGTFSHERADRPVDWKCDTGREVHGIWLKSDRLRLVGKADVVEFHPRADGPDQPFPVEYKRGKRRKWDNDDVQLCAQAICLEEMLGIPIPRGAIYHIKTKRRRDVEFTPTLRNKTEMAARRSQMRRRHKARGFNPGKTALTNQKSPERAEEIFHYESISRNGHVFNDRDSPAPLTGLRNLGGGA